MEKEDIINRWSEHITELYHDDRSPPPIINNDEGPQILEEEVQKDLKKDEKKARPQDQRRTIRTANRFRYQRNIKTSQHYP